MFAADTIIQKILCSRHTVQPWSTYLTFLCIYFHHLRNKGVNINLVIELFEVSVSSLQSTFKQRPAYKKCYLSVCYYCILGSFICFSLHPQQKSLIFLRYFSKVRQCGVVEIVIDRSQETQGSIWYCCELCDFGPPFLIY